MPKQVNLPNRISIRISDQALYNLHVIKSKYLKKNKLEKVSTGTIIEDCLKTFLKLK